MNPRHWTPEQDAHLRAHYHLDLAAIERATGRSRFAIYCRAVRLGVTKPQAWTPDHSLLLEAKWGVWTIKKLAETLGRTKGAVHAKAYELGLETGCPEGYEYIKHAADHFGYDNETFLKILRWARVPRRESLSRPERQEPRRPWRMVNMELAAKAVAAWMQTEAVKPAARARGISHTRIYTILNRYGKDLPRRPRRGKKWNIPSTVIDAAIEAWRRDTTTSDEGAGASA